MYRDPIWPDIVIMIDLIGMAALVAYLVTLAVIA